MREALGLLVVAACRFDPAGVPDDGPRAADDASLDAPSGGPDAAVCASVTARIEVDGTPHASGSTPAEAVMVGDTVALSSQGSCGPGALTYAWQVSPIEGIRDTILPADDAGAITVYATLPDAYSVTLTVRDAGGATDAATIYAFDAIGFATVPGVPSKVRDVDVGDDRLWIATETGAVRVPLGALAPVTSIDAEAGGAALPAKTGAVLWDDARSALWVGAFDPAAGVWRVDYAAAPTATLIGYDALLGAAAKTFDLAIVREDAADTIAAATDRGTAFNPGGDAFETRFVTMPLRTTGVTQAGDTTWVLGDALHDLDAPATFPVIAGGEPTGLAADLDGEGVWVGNEMMGAAHVTRAGAGVDVTLVSGLATDKVRAFAVEPDGRAAGDVWVATQKGLARWKLDREVWVLYGNNQGLTGHLDLRAVAVASGSARAVYAGGAAGAVYAAPP